MTKGAVLQNIITFTNVTSILLFNKQVVTYSLGTILTILVLFHQRK